MHDPTEGGVAGGIHEMCDASELGVRVFEEKVAIQPETAKICNHFKIDPLQLISSGALLISAEAKSAGPIIMKMEEKKIHAAIIGEFLEDTDERLLVARDCKAMALPRPLSDELWTALTK